MLYCAPYQNLKVKKTERKEDALWIELEQGLQKLVPVDARSVRILYTKKEAFSNDEKPGILDLPAYSDWSHSEDEDRILLKLPYLQLEINKETNQFRYFDGAGNLLLQERALRSKELCEFPVYRMQEGSITKEYVDTPDGRKEVVRDAAKVQVGTAYHTRIHYEWGDEALYGLGQHEEGYHSLRGEKVYLHQANRKIAIPMLVSTKGYGILLNTYAPAIFNDTTEGSYLYTEADPEMDFFFMSGAGESCMDTVIREYRKITGKATMLPKWAFGYVQSQERYETQEEILSVAREYRKRGIGLDCIVLDWCSWKDGQWGQKTFDPARFPDVDAMTKALHDEHVHFMVSIWPNLTEGTPDFEEFKEKGLLLPGINNYNPLTEEGRKTYWKQANDGLFCHGVDAWWCDNSEPFTPEWNYPVKPESAKLYEEYCRITANHLPATMTNAYGFYHAQGIYEGQRRECAKEKRVVNLTRSGYVGQQRFGTILWSGDISASWETLRRQIAAGLHFCASGLPYWTVDIGAFFVKNGMQWFWDGQYDRGPADPAYCELFTRWYQWGAFLPVFRGHGTDFRRELWEFDHPKAPFYDALCKANQLRYELMPYIYSLAGKVWAEDASIMKPLAFGFPEDKAVWDVMDQYLFGDSLMICPVTTPGEYVEEDNREVWKHDGREVYFPQGCDWHDYWTGEIHKGGSRCQVAVSLDRIPIYVKDGSVIPKRKPALSTEEQTDEIQYVAYGEGGCFDLYEDAGDGYGYEKGEFSMTRIVLD